MIFFIDLFIKRESATINELMHVFFCLEQ